MKQAVIICALLVGLLNIFHYSNGVSAQEMQATESAQQETEEKVEYALPYPGMLPDHPLYFLKSIRDTIIGILISDPLKKAEFNLLNADKQIASISPLLEKGKEEEAQDTLVRAQDDMMAIEEELKKAKSQEKNINGFINTAKTAIKKHSEVVSSTMLINTKEGKEYESMLERLLEDFERIK